MDATSIQGVADMTQLTSLHEGSLIHNLRLRYKEDKIYVKHFIFRIRWLSDICWLYFGRRQSIQEHGYLYSNNCTSIQGKRSRRTPSPYICYRWPRLHVHDKKSDKSVYNYQVGPSYLSFVTLTVVNPEQERRNQRSWYYNISLFSVANTPKLKRKF